MLFSRVLEPCVLCCSLYSWDRISVVMKSATDELQRRGHHHSPTYGCLQRQRSWIPFCLFSPSLSPLSQHSKKYTHEKVIGPMILFCLATASELLCKNTRFIVGSTWMEAGCWGHGYILGETRCIFPPTTAQNYNLSGIKVISRHCRERIKWLYVCWWCLMQLNSVIIWNKLSLFKQCV